MKKEKLDPRLLKLLNDFRIFYDKNLKENYKKIEKIRKNHLKDSIIGFLIAILLLFCSSLIIMNFIINFITNPLTDDNPSYGILYGILLFILGYSLMRAIFVLYKEDVKGHNIETFFSFFNILSYSTEKYISPKIINKSKLYDITSCEADDYLEGTYQDIQFQISEQKCIQRGCTVFNGVVILLHLKKKLVSTTVVRSKFQPLYNFFYNSGYLASISVIILIELAIIRSYFLSPISTITMAKYVILAMAILFPIYSILSLIYCYKNENKINNNKNQVFLESSTFNKNWTILSEDPIEARYILSPILMEKMIEIKKIFHGKKIEFSFFEDKLLITILTQNDMFETSSLFTSIHSYKCIEEVVIQIYYLYTLIEILKKYIK